MAYGFGQLSTLLLASLFFAPGKSLAAVDEPASILHSEFGRANNDSLLWGPYRPNLYFGVRPRIPKSLMTGLMWGKVDLHTNFQTTLRYTCEQNEGMKGYGWDEYDARKGGIQSIHDTKNDIVMTTSFVKIPGGTNGGNWAARIQGKLMPNAPADAKTIVFYYITQEGFGSELESASPSGDGARNYEGDLTLAGRSDALGTYKLVITKGSGDQPSSDHELAEESSGGTTVVQAITYPDGIVWQGKTIVFKQLKERLDKLAEQGYGNQKMPPPWLTFQLENRPGHGNVQIVQKIFEGDFEFDVLFSSGSAAKNVTSEDLTRGIRTTTESFDKRFASVFDFKAPFTADKYKKFGRSMFSNLIGGIGYFYGEALVDRSYAAEYEEENEGFWEDTAAARARRQEKMEGPHELFTSIPSRPFFPRGFLWDEGFQLLPIADWDIDLTLEIVKSWFNMMDDDGWIAREQILGDEARSKVPAEFQVQYPHFANPPTLFLTLDSFLEKLYLANQSIGTGKESVPAQGLSLTFAALEKPAVGVDWLKRLYPLLRRHYDWFKKTQYGDINKYQREAFSNKEAYRWRGRTERHCLTSGLDDYPRAQPPHPGELHVDLMAWMGMMIKSLIRIAKLLDMPGEAERLTKSYKALERNLDHLHWSEIDGCYCDATIDDFEEHKLVCHKGYISLFPFLTGLVGPGSPRLGKILTLLEDEEELFSPHGLRSLSKKNAFYGTDENYWRSPVWININYLAILQLRDIASQEGAHQAKARNLYKRLRTNVVETVFKAWEETGFLWEQYNPETGKGQRTQHFTGWTSLVVKIMAMEEVVVGGSKAKDEL